MHKIILRGDKVILRPIKVSDANRFIKWLSSPDVNKYTTRKPVSLKEEIKWIKSLSKNKDEIHWAIDTKDEIHIGSIGLEINKQDKKAGFDIFIGDKSYWGQGYGYEASLLIMNYAFTKLKLHRIYLSVYIYNSRAIKLYKKLGFKIEGRGRESIFYKNKFYDQIFMGILKKEWLKYYKKIKK